MGPRYSCADENESNVTNERESKEVEVAKNSVYASRRVVRFGLLL
jgi:hypothetical protein